MLLYSQIHFFLSIINLAEFELSISINAILLFQKLNTYMNQTTQSRSVTKTVNQYETTIRLMKEEWLEIRVKAYQIQSVVSHGQIQNCLNQDHNFSSSSEMENHANCKIAKFFVGKFEYETLHQECKNSFEKLKDLFFEALKNEDSMVIEMKEESAQIVLRVNTLINRRNLPANLRFLLKQKQYCYIYNNNAKFQQAKELKPAQNKYQEAIQLQNEILKKKLAQANNILEISQKSVEMLKNKETELKIFVENFIQKIQRKWEKQLNQQGKINKSINHFKGTMHGKSEVIPKKQKPLSSQQRNHYFSAICKHASISLLTKKKAKCESNKRTFKAILVNPLTFQSAKQTPPFEIFIKINNICFDISLGICEKQTVVQSNYESNGANIKGCYLLNSNGEILFIDRSQKQVKQSIIKSMEFGFKKDDVIKITFNQHIRLLQFFKLGWALPVKIPIGGAKKLSDLCFCVFLQGKGDEVQIIDMKN